MSTVVIVFPGAPKVDPAAAAREEAMKRNVAKHVEGERLLGCSMGREEESRTVLGFGLWF